MNKMPIALLIHAAPSLVPVFQAYPIGAALFLVLCAIVMLGSPRA